jgi:hypothetical protein
MKPSERITMDEPLNKRSITKTIAKTVTECAAAFLITRTLSKNVPASNRLKIASMAGSVGGWAIGAKLAPHIDRVVDEFFDRREARVRY